jgi:hypothetical protein
MEIRAMDALLSVIEQPRRRQTRTGRRPSRPTTTAVMRTEHRALIDATLAGSLTSAAAQCSQARSDVPRADRVVEIADLVDQHVQLAGKPLDF